MPWDPQVTEEVWTSTFKQSAFTCTEPQQYHNFLHSCHFQHTIQNKHLNLFLLVQHPACFYACQRNRSNNRFESLFVITYKLFPYILCSIKTLLHTLLSPVEKKNNKCIKPKRSMHRFVVVLSFPAAIATAVF